MVSLSSVVAVLILYVTSSTLLSVGTIFVTVSLRYCSITHHLGMFPAFYSALLPSVCDMQGSYLSFLVSSDHSKSQLVSFAPAMEYFLFRLGGRMPLIREWHLAVL